MQGMNTERMYRHGTSPAPPVASSSGCLTFRPTSRTQPPARCSVLIASVAGENSQPRPAAPYHHDHSSFCRVPRFYRMTLTNQPPHRVVGGPVSVCRVQYGLVRHGHPAHAARPSQGQREGGGSTKRSRTCRCSSTPPRPRRARGHVNLARGLPTPYRNFSCFGLDR